MRSGIGQLKEHVGMAGLVPQGMEQEGHEGQAAHLCCPSLIEGNDGAADPLDDLRHDRVSECPQSGDSLGDHRLFAF